MVRQIWDFVGEGIDGYIHDEALTRGAAIAFYIVTAIAPVLYIAVAVAGLVMGPAAAHGALAAALGHIMGHDGVALLQTAAQNARGTSTGIVGSVLGIAVLIVTASGVFGEMEDALNLMWHVPRKGPVLPRLLRGRAISLVLVILLGFLLVLSMLATATIAALQHYIQVATPYSQFSLAALNLTLSFVLATLLFAAIYKVVPNRDLEWRDVLAGAAGTAALFLIGQTILGTLLGGAGIGRPYGAAGGLMLLLLWVYYSAQVFLLGAEFTKVYAKRFGSLRRFSVASSPGPASGGSSPPSSADRTVS
jgi:membrane protein